MKIIPIAVGTYLKYTFFPSASCFLPGKVPKRSAFEVFQTSITLANVHELWLIITCWVKISCHKCLPPKPLVFLNFTNNFARFGQTFLGICSSKKDLKILFYFSGTIRDTTLHAPSPLMFFQSPYIRCHSSCAFTSDDLHVPSQRWFFFHVPSSQVFLLGFFFMCPQLISANPRFDSAEGPSWWTAAFSRGIKSLQKDQHIGIRLLRCKIV